VDGNLYPRVRCATLGFVGERLRGSVVGGVNRNPECAARRWALLEKGFAVRLTPYDRLIGIVRFFSQWVLRFENHCAVQFKQLGNQKIQIGSMNLKIAAIALVEKALLLSANPRDFQQVPNLQVEDWLH
jgi:hypothetical protein